MAVLERRRGPGLGRPLETFDPNDPVLSQLAWDPRRNAAFAVTGSRLVRVDVAADCSASIAWTKDLGTDSLNGSPTIAGDTVWFALSDGPELLGVDTGTGRTVASLTLPGRTVSAPTVLDGRIFVPTFTGQLVGFASAAASSVRAGPSAPRVPGHSSWVDAKHGWVSRESGVFATDDGGRHWEAILGRPATTVVRTSLRAGIVRTATTAAGCTCAYDLWTVDGGLHWTATRTIGDGLVGRGNQLYWVSADGTAINQVSPWPPQGRLASQVVARADAGTVADLVLVPGGVAALIRNRSTGSLSLLTVEGDAQETTALPAAPGVVLGQSLHADGSAHRRRDRPGRRFAGADPLVRDRQPGELDSRHRLVERPSPPPLHPYPEVSGATSPAGRAPRENRARGQAPAPAAAVAHLEDAARVREQRLRSAGATWRRHAGRGAAKRRRTAGRSSR